MVRQSQRELPEGVRSVASMMVGRMLHATALPDCLLFHTLFEIASIQPSKRKNAILTRQTPFALRSMYSRKVLWRLGQCAESVPAGRTQPAIPVGAALEILSG